MTFSVTGMSDYHKWEIMGVSLAGALPGIALFMLARRLRNRG